MSKFTSATLGQLYSPGTIPGSIADEHQQDDDDDDNAGERGTLDDTAALLADEAANFFGSLPAVHLSTGVESPSHRNDRLAIRMSLEYPELYVSQRATACNNVDIGEYIEPLSICRNDSSVSEGDAAGLRQALQSEKDKELALWMRFSGNTMGVYPNLAVVLIGMFLTFTASGSYLLRVVAPLWHSDDRPHWACFISVACVGLCCCIICPLFFLLSLPSKTRGLVSRIVPGFVAVTIVLIHLNEILSPLLGINGILLEQIRCIWSGEIPTPNSYSWELIVAFTALKWNFVSCMGLLILGPNRGIEEDRRYLYNFCFCQLLFVISVICSVAISDYTLELAGSAKARLKGAMIVSAIVVFANAILSFMFLVSWRPRWVVYCPDSGATKPKGRPGWSLNADEYMPQPIKLLSKIFPSPFVISTATTSIFFSGFFISAFLISGVFKDIDPTGTIIFSILVVTISIQRMGLYSREVVVRHVLSDVLSREGARVMLENTILMNCPQQQPSRPMRSVLELMASGINKATSALSSHSELPSNSNIKNVDGSDRGQPGISNLANGPRRFSHVHVNLNHLSNLMNDGIDSVTPPNRNSASWDTASSERMEAALNAVTSLTAHDLPQTMAIPVDTSKVTVIFSDIVGFTTMCSGCPPPEVFAMLHEYFNKLDYMVTSCGIFKYQTIGDAYVAVSNLHGNLTKEQNAVTALTFGYMMVRIAESCELPRRLGNGGGLEIRVGMHTGAVAGSVLGRERAALTFIGDTMNMASRMESNSCPGCLRLSQATFQMLSRDVRHAPGIKQQKIDIKGKGPTVTYLLDCNNCSSLQDALWPPSVSVAAHCLTEGLPRPV